MDRQFAPRIDPNQGFLADPKGRKLCRLLVDAGHQAYFVGGCVRNFVMSQPASDVDIATDARPDRVMTLVRDEGLRAVPTGVDHGTVTVLVEGTPFEVTTFRSDVATDGRRAVVAFADSMEEDAHRRDFTMNALYCDLDGQIHDPVEGFEDARARRVRFIDDANRRIVEDYLRILRFFRFSAWYADPEDGWDADTLDAIARNVDGLNRLSAERVGAELMKLLAAPDPAPALAAMDQAGVLSTVLPGADPRFVAPLVHLEQAFDAKPNPVTRFAALGNGEAAKRLRLSRKVQHKLDMIRSLAGTTHGPRAIGYLAGSEVGIGAILLRAAMLGNSIPAGSASALDDGVHRKFPISSKDLPDYSGPDLGHKLKTLKQAWLDSDLKLTKAELLGS